jgi:hypothetical protein
VDELALSKVQLLIFVNTVMNFRVFFLIRANYLPVKRLSTFQGRLFTMFPYICTSGFQDDLLF